MTDRTDRIEARIRRRVRARMGWFVHALVYACVITGLTVLGFVTGKHVAGFAAAGWGLGLAIHGLVVWLAPLADGMQARMIERERARLGAGGERF